MSDALLADERRCDAARALDHAAADLFDPEPEARFDLVNFSSSWRSRVPEECGDGIWRRVGAARRSGGS